MTLLTRVAAMTVVTTLSIASAARGGDYKMLRTATSNIGCGADTTYLRCDIRGGVKPLPPTPKDCQLDWGGGMAMGRTGPSYVMCAGDTTMDPHASVIAAGTTWHHGPFACAFQSNAVRCTNASGRGFFLSTKRSYRF